MRTLLLATLALPLPAQVAPELGTSWTLTTSATPGCPLGLYLPVVPPFPLQGGGPIGLDVVGCIPSAPFLVCAQEGLWPGLGCVLGLGTVLCYGVADSAGYAILGLRLPTYVPEVPQGLTYLGYLQVISFADVANYATSSPMLIYAMN